MNAKYRILNYPQTIEGCHDLIKILVAELNEGASTANNSIPLADDKKFQLFSDCSENNKGLNGGVSFEGVGGHRPPLAHESTVRGYSYGPPCN